MTSPEERASPGRRECDVVNEHVAKVHQPFLGGRVVVLHYFIVASAISVLVLTWQQWRTIKRFNENVQQTNEILAQIYKAMPSRGGK